LGETRKEEASLIKQIRQQQTAVEQGKAAINDMAMRSHLLTRLMTAAASGELRFFSLLTTIAVQY